MRVPVGLRVFLASLALVLPLACASAPPALPAPLPPPPAVPVTSYARCERLRRPPCRGTTAPPRPRPRLAACDSRGPRGGHCRRVTHHRGGTTPGGITRRQAGCRLGAPGDAGSGDRQCARRACDGSGLAAWSRDRVDPRCRAARARHHGARLERRDPIPGDRGRCGPVRLHGCAHSVRPEDGGGQNRLPRYQDARERRVVGLRNGGGWALRRSKGGREEAGGGNRDPIDQRRCVARPAHREHAQGEGRPVGAAGGGSFER